MNNLTYEMQGLTWQARKKNQQDAILIGYLHYMVEISSSSKYSSPPYNSTKVGI